MTQAGWGSQATNAGRVQTRLIKWHVRCALISVGYRFTGTVPMSLHLGGTLPGSDRTHTFKDRLGCLGGYIA
jgi:hypothetical protein